MHLKEALTYVISGGKISRPPWENNKFIYSDAGILKWEISRFCQDIIRYDVSLAELLSWWDIHDFEIYGHRKRLYEVSPGAKFKFTTGDWEFTRLSDCGAHEIYYMDYKYDVQAAKRNSIVRVSPY